MKKQQYSKTPATKTATTNKRAEISDDDSDVEDDASQPSTSQASTAKRPRNDCINLCRSCEQNECNVILFPCTHASLCFGCWTKKSMQGDKFCVTCYEAVTNAQRFA